MKSGTFSSPQSADEWMDIADRELSNLSKSYIGGLTNEMKADHALRAVEAALKAIFWKHEGLTAWPKNDANHKFLYRHNLDTLLMRCGLQTRLKAHRALWASWQTLVNASTKINRYSPQTPSDTEVHQIAKSARHPDLGIVPWLKKHYATMS